MPTDSPTLCSPNARSGISGRCCRGNAASVARIVFVACALVALLSGCAEKGEEKPAEPKTESRVSHGTNGEVLVTVDAATQQAMGLETEPLKAAEAKRQVKAYGRVLDAAPLVNSVTEFKTTQAAAMASQAELARLKTLASQNNASQRALEAAESAALRDQAQVESARLHLVSAWGEALAGRPDLPELTHSLATLGKALVQLSLPAGEVIGPMPATVRLTALRMTNSIPAQVLGPAAMVDPQFPGQAFLVLVATNTARLSPGEALTGYFDAPGEAQNGVALPAAAVVRFNGLAWVYVQRNPEAFERVGVELELPLESGWLIRRKLQPADRVVVTGAQDLLSEELKREDAE